ncbi:hypothetical protein Ccar_13950 [Clostridium carboxidivorans P7]|uniref:Uncharacterized protein n=1 Tax=Clostridium carboxidivorans P7 TaxID=536227 RepID=C6PS50_9CLOT|nr:hypothetical protein Ccar_13950 [Clostridium carboxidivorans P7]EET87975.1 hypothetical protein CcarbDRAFT_1617 [Clostridium carboxidivorans P7]
MCKDHANNLGIHEFEVYEDKGFSGGNNRHASISENDLQLITIIQHILPLIHDHQILSFLIIADEFVHKKTEVIYMTYFKNIII